METKIYSRSDMLSIRDSLSDDVLNVALHKSLAQPIGDSVLQTITKGSTAHDGHRRARSGSIVFEDDVSFLLKEGST